MEIQGTAPSSELCCPPLGEHVRYDAKEAEEAAATLKALADPARITLVSILAARPGHSHTTRELAPQLGVSEPTVSHHLKRLAAVGIVSPTRDGARVNYRLETARVREVSNLLNVRCECSDSCC